MDGRTCSQCPDKTLPSVDNMRCACVYYNGRVIHGQLRLICNMGMGKFLRRQKDLQSVNHTVEELKKNGITRWQWHSKDA